MLVTGANGFVGRALCAEAVSRGMAVRGITRASGYLPISVEKFAVDGIDGNTDWQDVLTGCEVVVHLAARVDVMAYTSANPLATTAIHHGLELLTFDIALLSIVRSAPTA